MMMELEEREMVMMTMTTTMMMMMMTTTMMMMMTTTMMMMMMMMMMTMTMTMMMMMMMMMSSGAAASGWQGGGNSSSCLYNSTARTASREVAKFPRKPPQVVSEAVRVPFHMLPGERALPHVLPVHVSVRLPVPRALPLGPRSADLAIIGIGRTKGRRGRGVMYC